MYEHQDWGSLRFQLNLNMNENLKIFMIKFPKFDNLYATFLLQKNGKNVEIQKEQKQNEKNFFYQCINLAYFHFYLSFFK